MATQNLPQNSIARNGQPSSTNNPIALTRRDLLLSLTKAGVAALAAVPLMAALPALAESGEEMVTFPKSLLEPVPALPPPYGPPERTAAVDYWIERIDSVIITLERLWTFLGEARALPNNQVDGDLLLALELKAIEAIDNLGSDLATCDDSHNFDALYPALTGKRSCYWSIKGDIEDLSNKGFDRDFYQAEIDATRRDDPATAAELQALLNARVQVAL